MAAGLGPAVLSNHAVRGALMDGRVLAVPVEGGPIERADVPEWLDYDRWLGPAPFKPYTKDRCSNQWWWFISDYALGFIAGWGIHPIDIALWDIKGKALGLPVSTLFRLPQDPAETGKGFSLAQKMVGRACGLPEGQGVRPGTYCEPKMTTVGSQDTTGPMTRDELKDLACLGFSADLVMQSFCHTAAYPKLVDVKMHRELPSFISTRGGVSLRPGDGVIHSWLNRLLLPDTVGTGGDSHTRFPIGISFPAGSGLVAFAAATGVMPLDMPESVLVRFKGTMQPGVTLRDMVNAIPLYAIKQGLLTVAKKGKQNIFSGRILEIEGLPDLKVEQAFELSDASAVPESDS